MQAANFVWAGLIVAISWAPPAGGSPVGGREHDASASQTLESMEGDYTLTTRFWPAADAPPVVTVLAARRRLALDGQVLRIDIDSGADGFQGTGLMGFDDSKKRYWYVWTDTSVAGRSVLEGALTSEGIGRLEGETPTPDGYAPVRVEIARDGSTETHEYFGAGPAGDTYRWLELRYERTDSR